MADKKKVIKGLEICTSKPCYCTDCPYKANCYLDSQEVMEDALALLNEQELPTELKQKMWNAFYAEEDKYENKFVGKEEHHNWFAVYRPWLQKGFDIAINAIADWEGR